tara:strand:+ start:11027 stop:11254 length:228 start_codon:yes stop_codon:yes gene_type:complete
MSFTVEDIQKHQQELETHLQELVETMEKQKEKINALHGAITTCKYFSKLVGSGGVHSSTGTSPVYENQKEIPFGD